VTVVDRTVEGQHISVMLGTREAGTRVGIHVHESGGTTFVVGGKGRITDFVEGFPNSLNPVGSYYYMPANIPMSAANLSSKDVRLMDVFVTPAGAPPITIIEPGWVG
jgi:quercetin dioxygenase-like cupin family protein